MGSAGYGSTCEECGGYHEASLMDCAVPALREALRPETEAELRSIRWLAGCERMTVDRLLAMLRRLRRLKGWGPYDGWEVRSATVVHAVFRARGDADEWLAKHRGEWPAATNVEVMPVR